MLYQSDSMCHALGSEAGRNAAMSGTLVLSVIGLLVLLVVGILLAEGVVCFKRREYYYGSCITALAVIAALCGTLMWQVLV